MLDRIKDVEIYFPVFRSENPAFDSSFILKNSGSAVVRITTESGVEGFGMTFGEPVGEYIEKTLKEEIIGFDRLSSEDIWNAMFAAIRSSGRKGVALLAMSALDIAIWDIKGKLLKLPVFRLLGGSKTKIPCYASVGFLSMPDDECVEKSLEYIANGFKTLKIKVGYDAGKNIAADVLRVEKVRKAVGSAIEIIVDANGIYDAATAIRFAHAAAGLDICLFEEPVHADDIPGLRRVREAGGIPVATGENEYTKYGCRDLLIASCADVLQFDVTRAGGITEMVKLSAMAQAWNLRIAPHFWPQYSAHLLSPAPHGLYLEVFPTPPNAPSGGQIVLNQPSTWNGYYEISDSPGFGLDYDIDYLRTYRLRF